jgi:hypothetical protein
MTAASENCPSPLCAWARVFIGTLYADLTYISGTGRILFPVYWKQ